MIKKQIKVDVLLNKTKEEVIFENKPNKCIKGEDSKEYWISRSVATVGVIMTKYKGNYYILIGKRGFGAADFKGFLNLPCGYLDYNETGAECFIREVYEECGFFVLDIPKEQIIMDYTKKPYFVQTDMNSNRQNVSLYYGIVFKTKKEDKLPTLSLEYNEKDEVEWVNWVDVDNILINPSMFAFSHNEKIKDFLKMFKKDMKWYRRFLRFIKVI